MIINIIEHIESIKNIKPIASELSELEKQNNEVNEYLQQNSMYRAQLLALIKTHAANTLYSDSLNVHVFNLGEMFITVLKRRSSDIYNKIEQIKKDNLEQKDQLIINIIEHIESIKNIKPIASELSELEKQNNEVNEYLQQNSMYRAQLLALIKTHAANTLYSDSLNVHVFNLGEIFITVLKRRSSDIYNKIEQLTKNNPGSTRAQKTQEDNLISNINNHLQQISNMLKTYEYKKDNITDADIQNFLVHVNTLIKKNMDYIQKYETKFKSLDKLLGQLHGAGSSLIMQKMRLDNLITTKNREQEARQKQENKQQERERQQEERESQQREQERQRGQQGSQRGHQYGNTSYPGPNGPTCNFTIWSWREVILSNTKCLYDRLDKRLPQNKHISKITDDDKRFILQDLLLILKIYIYQYMYSVTNGDDTKIRSHSRETLLKSCARDKMDNFPQLAINCLTILKIPTEYNNTVLHHEIGRTLTDMIGNDEDYLNYKKYIQNNQKSDLNDILPVLTEFLKRIKNSGIIYNFDKN